MRTDIVEEGHLARYLALHRNGALEFELGEGGAYRYSTSGSRAFRLILTVGRVRAALRLWAEIRDYLKLTGPAELSLALRGTRGTALGNLADGYPQPSSEVRSRLCPAKHLLLRRDLWDWPDEARQLDLALSIGDWLEDAWGGQERRFLAPNGPLKGQFDRSHYA